MLAEDRDLLSLHTFSIVETSILLYFPYSTAEVGLDGRKGICELGVACEQVLRKLALTLTN